jgi:hypothetical protein
MQRHQPSQPLRLERRSPLGDELVVAGQLAANIDSAFSVTPKHNAARSARQGSITVTPAHHGIQFSALFDRQHGSLHASISGSNAADFNDSVD